MWTVEDIRARWLEAADVERRLRVKGLPTSGNAWPVYTYDAEDRAGWDETAKQDDLERWQAIKVATSDEISRWGECYFEWHMKFVPENRRRLLWTWARCLSGVDPRTFSKACEHNGWARPTAYDRLERLFEHVQGCLRIALTPLRPAAEKWRRQIEGPTIPESINSTVVCPAGPTIYPPFFRTEKSTDLLTTPAAIAAFAQHLADVREQRRKLRRRKALRGVPGEQEAA